MDVFRIYIIYILYTEGINISIDGLIPKASSLSNSGFNSRRQNYIPLKRFQKQEASVKYNGKSVPTSEPDGALENVGTYSKDGEIAESKQPQSGYTINTYM